MASFLLIISLLLHLIALFSIYQLFKMIQSLKKNQIDDVEQLLSLYLEEFREENEKLERRLAAAPNSRESAAVLHPERESVFPSDLSEGVQIAEAIDGSEGLEAVDSVEDEIETSLQSQILLLHNQGKSDTEIARQLNCGKTEVELTLKLHGNGN